MKKIFYSTVVISAALALPYAPRETRAASGDGGFWIGPANLSPTFTARVFYESNPDEVNESRRKIMREKFMAKYGKKRDKASQGFNVTPGLLLHVPGNQWELSGGIHATYEKDNSDFSRDPKDWNQSLRLSGMTDGGTKWGLSQSWQRLHYSQYDDFSQDDRDSYAFSGSLSKDITDKSGLGLSASYRILDYKDEELYDNNTLTAGLSARHRLTDKSNLILSLDYSNSEGDYRRWVGSDGAIYRGRRSNNRSYTAQAGLGSRATEKITYNALLGLSLIQPDDYVNPRTGERTSRGDKYRVAYALSGNWKRTERLSFSISGKSSYESSEDVLDNSLMAYNISGMASYRLFDRLRLNGGASYRYEDYLRRVETSSTQGGNPYVGTDDKGRGKSRTDDQVSLYGTIAYGINRYASAFLNGTYTKTSSTIKDFDYDRYRLSAGVSLRY